MSGNEVVEKIKRNIYGLSRSMDDAPYHGVSAEVIRGVNFAIGKILKDTGITLEEIIEEESE